jgi:hypothetical protein
MDIGSIFIDHSVDQLRRAVSLVPFTDEDREAVIVLSENPQAVNQQSFFQRLLANGSVVTQGLWAFYLLASTREWTDKEKEIAVAFPSLRELYPSPGDTFANELLDAAAESFEDLAWVGYDSGDGSEDENSELADKLSKGFYRLALATEKVGDAGRAYDLAAIAMSFNGGDLPFRESIARYGLGHAVTADQIALFSSRVASVISEAADQASERRLEAFDACERAIELLAFGSGPIRTEAAQVLRSVIEPRQYLRLLLLPVYFFLPDSERPEGVFEAFGADYWPERISREPLAEWTNRVRVLWNAQRWDLELEKARLVLEGEVAGRGAQADWTTWMIDHPAYRRVVPHHRSFLREVDFDRHLLQLTHEITHVLSLLGGIGFILTALRVAAFDCELVQWSLNHSSADDLEFEMAANEGVATLRDGAAGSLFRAEQALEIAFKAKILQDVWTPWFEGLAVFSEGAADPALDPVGIGPVTECLRNLLDFHPPSGLSEEEVKAAFEELLKEFEQRCSAAINKVGPGRLRMLLGTPEVPYLAGYLAVRSVVSAWRETTGRPLTGTETFNLLLNATRFGTFNAVPNLSLNSEQFASAAQELMCDWASKLAALSCEEIEDFLKPPNPNDSARWYRWEDSHLIRVETGRSHPGDGEREAVEQRIGQAMRSLWRVEDFSRFKEQNVLVEALKSSSDGTEEWIHEHMKRNMGFFETWVSTGSFLPIGRTASRFFANIDQASTKTLLATHMRTAESIVPTGNPSLNGLWFPIDNRAGQMLEKFHRRNGSPRLEVTRIIDLGSFVTKSRDRFGSHFLAYRYGDWFDIRGANPAVESWLEEDLGNRETVREYVERRIYPNTASQAELKAFASGDRGAKRTRDWIDRSMGKDWFVDDQLVSVGSWAIQVRELAERFLNEDGRRHRQGVAAGALLTKLFDDESIAEDVVNMGFVSLGDHPRRSLTELKDALFATAKAPAENTVTSAVISDFNSHKFRTFHRGKNGWDVRPAKTV